MTQLFGQTLCAPQPERDFFFFLQQTSALWFRCTVDHSSCVELLLSSLLICRTSCSSVFNVSACLCVHCYVRRGWKTWPAAPLSGRQHNANSLWETTSEQRKWECLAGWCRFMFGHRNNSSHTTWHYRQLYLSLENSSDWVRMLSNNWVVLELDDGSVGSSYIWP